MDQEIKTVIQYPTGSTEFDIPFDYLSRKFVRVSLVANDNRRLLSNITEYRYVSKTRVKILVDTTGFDRVEIRRFTSASERVVDFSDGSVLRANDLNVSQLQSSHIAEEARDSALMAMPEDDAGNLDARNRKIVRLAPGEVGSDAVNKDQLDAAVGDAGGILSDVKKVQQETYDYIEKFADDTALVRGVSWVYNQGSANGGETSILIDKPTRVLAVPCIEVNGLRQEVGYHFSFDIATQRITLVKPLVAGDFLMALTTESSVPVEDLLANPTGASSVGTSDGRNVQVVLDGLTADLQTVRSAVSPKEFGGVPNTDATAAIKLAIAAAVVRKAPLDLRSGPWTITETLDMTDVKTVISDATGVLRVDPTAFTSKFTNKYAVTFGNPDVPYGQGRAGHVQVLGTLVVSGLNRTAPLNGVYFKGSWFAANVVRVSGLDGSAIVLEAVWDSVFQSFSGELCGNETSYQIDIRSGGDTSNCLHIGRIQSERAYHKCLRISAIRSVFNTIHAERTAVLTTDDGSNNTDGTKYTTLVMTLGNSVVNQLIHDAISGNAPDGRPTVGIASSRIDADFCVINAAGLSSSGLSSNSGRNTTWNGMVVRKWTFSGTATGHTIVSPRIIESLVPNNSITVKGGTAGQVSFGYNAKDVQIDSMAIDDLSFPNTIRGNINFTSCTFPETLTIGSTRAPEGYTAQSTLGETNTPVTFTDCVHLGTLTGAFQSRCVWKGGYVANISLASRAAVELYNVSTKSFSATGDRAYITRQVRATNVGSWGVPTHVAYPIGTITERLGTDELNVGTGFRNSDGTTTGFVKIY